MARAVSHRRMALVTVLAWGIGLLICFPILWTVLTSFKTEGEAVSLPPKFLFFDWTTENYGVVQERSDYVKFAMNSVALALGSTFFALLIAIPSAWAMAFAPGKRTKDLLMWMLSTKMMPPVGALIPIYLIFRDLGLLDTRAGIIMVLMLLNLLPILPLDGGRILASVLPHRMAWQYAKLEPWGFPILLLLLFTGYLGVILGPMLNASFALIGTVFQL